MANITVKLEETLTNDASAILDELGLDLPTAIRMYLKSIIRENGLPINTKLSEKVVKAPAPAPAKVIEETPVELPVLIPTVIAEEIPEADEVDEEVIPAPQPAAAAAPKTVIDYETRNGRKAIAKLFIDTICQIPAGSISRWSDVEAKLSAEYGTEMVRPQSIRWPAVTDDGAEIPYWRMVGERGAVRGDKMIEQSVQEAKLTEEGLTFVPAGHGIFTGIKVEDYKNKLVQW